MGFNDCVHVFHATVADLQGVVVEDLLQLLPPGGKCIAISLRNVLAMLVLTSALYGGLNHMIFLERFFFGFLGYDVRLAAV